MSGRRIELSVTQVTSSVLAAVTGAIVASSLGVAGTVIGVAVVSFATTAGTAIYRHYLGRTQERLRSAAAAMGHLATATDGHTRPGHAGASTRPMTGHSRAGAAHKRGGQAAPGPSGEPMVSGRRYGAPSTARHPAGGQDSGGQVPGARTAGRPAYGGQPNGGQPNGGQPNGGQGPGGSPTGQPGSPVHETWIIPVQVAARLRAESAGPAGVWQDGGQPGGGASEPDDSETGTALDGNSAAAGTQRTGPADAGPDGDGGHAQKPWRQKLAAVIDWARTERWPKFAAIAVTIFVVAMGGITILEAATGKPLDALIWGAHNSGTTVGNVVSGPAHRSHHPGPVKPSGTPAPHRTTHHTPSPTPSTATPTPTPRATQPTPAPTPTPTPTAHTTSPSATPTPATTHSPNASGGPATP
jgi:hypothetical protein